MSSEAQDARVAAGEAVPALPDGISQQQIGAAVSKLISASVGDVAIVFSRSAEHKHYAFADLEWMILPAVVTGQCYVAELQHTELGTRAPVAAVLWASVSAETDQRLSANPAARIRLRPDEWKGGEHLWIVDIAGEPAAIGGALNELAGTILKGKTVKVVMLDASGRPSIETLHALIAQAAAVAKPRGAA